MAKKRTEKKSRQVVISIPEISKAGMDIFKKATKIANSARQSKITIRLEKE